jgi:hypothetical protein
MVSGRMVHKIEEHWETIAARLLRRIQKSADLPNMQTRPESDLREAARRILANLGEYLTPSGRAELAGRYQDVGRKRCDEGLPLAEAIRVLQFMREETFLYIRDEGMVQTTMDAFAEEELAHQLAHFFDFLQFNLIKGYEERLRHPAPAHRPHVAIA